MPRRPRRHLSRILVMTLALALTAVATPVTLAAKPIRTVSNPVDPFTIPAGLGCAFDIDVAPSADIRVTVTEFDDGRVQTHAHGSAVLTNVDNGQTFTHRVRYHATDTISAATNELVSVVEGQVNIYFWPGDVGPFGAVSADGAIYRFTGRVHLTFDLDTEAITAVQYSGKIQDVCAELS
jgi:hypothetical protein